MIIYCIRNIKNGKAYIGQTTKKLKRRKAQHISDLSMGKHTNTYLQNAWNKYGKEAFEISILLECETLEELNEKEIYYINQEKSMYYQNGYNIEYGGSNYERPPIIGEKVREKLSTPVLQYDKQGNFIREWSSITEAQDNTIANNISNVVTGKMQSSGGFMWRYKTDNYPKKIEPYNNTYGDYAKKKVAQYDLDGNLIKVWDSITEAQKETGTKAITSSIQRDGTANNFKWKYYGKEREPQVICRGQRQD